MIRIGPAGWSYRDWDGIVYPAHKPKGFDPLAYLAQYFKVIEINSTFYGPPTPAATKKWTERVNGNPEFRFTAKLYERFTHKRDATVQDERAFKDGIAPLLEAGKLGALLLQFPWSFRFDADNRRYLLSLQRRFSECLLVLEVRHATWAQEEALDLLGELNIGLANIDQPLFHRSIKPGIEVTSSVAYIRLHGRNYKNWFREEANVRERYDYLYSLDELEPWADRIRAVSLKASETYAVANNHNIGKAPVNALQLASILYGREMPAPPSLIEHYPVELRGVAKPE